ncbi:hypothetical protein [Myxococcus sp. Y35]|uniref:hypothetical protein n=1 Tax=Pseudomyxococcus flavus TaxID=3115648 RepID=UPI003CF8F075
MNLSPQVAATGGGQRQRALEVTRQCPPGSVGAAIRPLLTGVMGVMGATGHAAGALPGALVHAMPVVGPVLRATGATSPLTRLGPAAETYAREFGAGQVGEFYEQQRELLSQPATEANIAEFARRETEFFQRQPSAEARAFASILSAEDRAALIGLSARFQRQLP